jgi:hypothetical protein
MGPRTSFGRPPSSLLDPALQATTGLTFPDSAMRHSGAIVRLPPANADIPPAVIFPSGRAWRLSSGAPTASRYSPDFSPGDPDPGRRQSPCNAIFRTTRQRSGTMT